MHDDLLKQLSGKRKTPVLLKLLIAIGAIIVLALSTTGPYVDYLWFREDAHYPRVFLLQYTVRGSLFLISFLAMWALLRWALSRLATFHIVYNGEVDPRAKPIAWILDSIQVKGGVWALWVSLAFAFFGAQGFSDNWLDWLLFKNGTDFGKSDFIFHRDFGFYVFKLPWLADVVGAVLGTLILALVFDLVATFGLAGIARSINAQAAWKGKPRWPLFLGLSLLALGFSTILNMYQSLSTAGALITGPGYAEAFGLKMQSVLAVLLIVVGLLLALTMVLKSVRAQPLLIACGILPLWYVIAVVGLPALVQRLKVEPDKVNVEEPYAAQAIAATTYAYGLGGLQSSETQFEDQPTAKEVGDASETFANMRLWDPGIVRDALDASQSLRSFYTFNDVDIDRYMIPNPVGQLAEQMVMIAPRDVFPEGLKGSARTWVNSKLAYTHGYGYVVTAVNQANQLGQLSNYVSNIPLAGLPQLITAQPGLYYGDFRDSDGLPSSDYTLVDTNVPEFDYPTESGSATTKWTGDAGMEVGGFFRRALLSFVLQDGNLLVSPNIKPTSRLVLHRSLLDRVQKIFPFLTFDEDPYLVTTSKGLYYIADAYTTTDKIPYSAQSSSRLGNLNYIRNSVKVVMDAYSGATTAYEIDGTDPILKTYENVYPGLIRPLSQMPAELRSHFRYPEDMFSVEAMVLNAYHVADARTFLENTDLWAVANQRDFSGELSQIRPYYVLIRLPNDTHDEFLLMLPFTPSGKDNMTGWLAAHCDGANYGHLSLYKFPKGSLVPGPALEENFFVQDKEIADINRNFNNDQSQIVVGSLLVIPVGQSVVYEESLFLKSRTAGSGSIPELRKVILATKSKIVVADNFEEAFQQLFGTSIASNASLSQPAPKGGPKGASPTKGTTGGPSGSPSQISSSVKSEVEAVGTLLDQADAALRKGDFAGYGRLQAEARQKLKGILGRQ